MDLELQDRFFVITDAEPGLGETVARALAAEGARVLSSTASNLAGKPAGEFVAQAEAEWGRLDGALVFVPVSLAGSDHEVRDDDWAAAFENSFLQCCRRDTTRLAGAIVWRLSGRRVRFSDS